MSTEPYAALKRAKEVDRHMPDGYWGADSPKCPHCGEVCNVSDNEWWKLYVYQWSTHAPRDQSPCSPESVKR